MTKKHLIFITALFSVALATLIIIQIYWIKSDFKVKEEVFEQKVNEALNLIAQKLEKQDSEINYKKIKIKSQGVLNSPIIKGKNEGSLNFKFSQELSIDSNGKKSFRYISKDIIGDSLKTNPYFSANFKLV